MKRLLVTCNFPPILGGQAKYHYQLWKGMDPADTHLLIPSMCRLPREKRQPNVHYVPVSFHESWAVRFIRFPLLLLYSFLFTVRIRPAEIHFGQLIVGGLCGLCIKTLTNIPFVVYCHGTDLLEFTRGSVGRLVVRAILTNCRYVVTCSNFTAGLVEQFMRKNPPRTFAVTPCVEDNFFTHDTQTTEKLKKKYKDKKILLSVGRLVQRKGHDMVLRACARLKQEFPELHYIIIGDGPYREALEKTVSEHKLEGFVTFCGIVDDSQLTSYYRIADIFIMVSRYLQDMGDIEGFGIVYLEANAAGLPVIAGKSGGVEDAVRDGETGILVNNPENVEEIARSIKKLLSDDLFRNKVISGAMAWARNNICRIIKDKWVEIEKNSNSSDV